MRAELKSDGRLFLIAETKAEAIFLKKAFRVNLRSFSINGSEFPELHVVLNSK